MIKKILKNKAVKIIILLHLVVLVLSAVFFFYIRYSANAYYAEAVQKAPYDVIIVPGFPYQDSTWHDIMKMRVQWSKYLFDKGLTHHIIYSGSAVYSPYVESVIMKEYAVAMGIPANKIFTETQAEHSTENLYYAYQIAKENNFEKIALATDPYQSYFLTYFAEEHNINVDYLPIQFDDMEDTIQDQKLSIDASSAYVSNFVSLPDRQSLLERLKGTLGKRIHRRQVN
jgi:uncharacterized SAM-binding protein YcdF (DUF218 family)